MDNENIIAALAAAGEDKDFRNALFQILRETEQKSDAPLKFKNQVRWPIIAGLLGKVKTTEVILNNGIIFDVSLDSRIEQALLLSPDEHPDHVWEPQTSKLLVMLGKESKHVIVGGAYIGDHVLLIAKGMQENRIDGTVHAFEPMEHTFKRLQYHIALNNVKNVIAHQIGLWDSSDLKLDVQGDFALASTSPHHDEEINSANAISSLRIDDYVASNKLDKVGLVMLDTEGAEERSLLGAEELLSSNAPHLIFEVHRNYVDWSNGLQNTSIVNFVESKGYQVYAIRDLHDNYPMKEQPIEIIPVNHIYLEGPPHGFNLFATTDKEIVNRLGLKIVKGVSPKLLVDKDPKLHHPLNGFK